MKVLLAIDDSPYSARVVEKVARRHWPHDTEFRILTVIEPVAIEEYGKGKWSDVIDKVVERRRAHAKQLCQQSRETLESEVADAIVHFEIREGNPRSEIVDAACEWSADKIIVGAHGRGACPRFILGSVSSAVAAHAPCSVEIIRAKAAHNPDHALSEATTAHRS